MKYLKNTPQANKRLAATLLRGLTTDLCAEPMVLDCYNDLVCVGIAPTITTRISEGNSHFLLQVYEVK